jgi:hypothetical protein
MRVWVAVTRFSYAPWIGFIIVAGGLYIWSRRKTIQKVRTWFETFFNIVVDADEEL